MQRSRFYRIATLCGIAAVAIGILCFAMDVFVPSSRVDARAADSSAPPAFRYELVRARTVTLTMELPGRVSAYMVSEVRPQVSGIIVERLFEEGTDVQAGQVLYQIDPALFEAAHNNAKATLVKAEANEVSARLLSQRYGRIVKSNAVSRQEYDDAVAAHLQAKAEVDSANQALETARINLGYTRVTAPISGTIGRSIVTPGALATQHQAEPLALIQHLDRVYVDVTYSNKELMRLRRAHAEGSLRSDGLDMIKVRLRLEGDTPYVKRSAASGKMTFEEVEGRLMFSDVTIEKSTGVVSIRALFDNPDKILLPGMYVRAVADEGTREDAVLIPQKLVMRDNRGRPYVYVLSREPSGPASETSALPDESCYYVAMRHVHIDRHHNNMWILSGGVEPGDKLLVEGQMKVRPGQIIKGIENRPEEAATVSMDQGR